MLSFGSNSQASGSKSSPRRPDTLQPQLFAVIQDEIRDAKRVHSHGQEEDLRQALIMVIGRVGELSSLLKEAYKTQTELEASLGVAKSNLQLVQMNNEMLEEALKRDSSGSAKDVGWRRWSAREVQTRDRLSEDTPRPVSSLQLSEPSPILEASPPALLSGLPPDAPAAPPTPVTVQETSRFFRFRFSSASSSSSASRPASRPGTPLGNQSVNGPSHPTHLSSPSLPSLPSHFNKELEDLTAQLESERAAHKTVKQEKAALEDEVESLSQALFEEANKMVATERKKLAEAQEELRETRLEKDALKSALRLVEDERLRIENSPPERHYTVPSYISHSRTSSRVAVKSRPSTPSPPSSPKSVVPIPETHPPSRPSVPPFTELMPSEPEPGHPSYPLSLPDPELTPHDPLRSMPPPTPYLVGDESPWADVQSSSLSHAPPAIVSLQQVR